MYQGLYKTLSCTNTSTFYVSLLTINFYAVFKILALRMASFFLDRIIDISEGKCDIKIEHKACLLESVKKNSSP